MSKHILSDSQIIELMNFDISDDDLDCSDVEFDLCMYFILLYVIFLTFNL